MKNWVFATISCLTLLTAATAFAQSNVVSRANVPFEFRVGKAILPAGHYEVRSGRVPDLLSIQCSDCKARATIITIPVETPKAAEASTLVFHRYNQTYFLAKVWTDGDSQGLELRKSKAERELARNGSLDEPVVVALARP